MTHRTVHVVVPAGIDDPARPSGGNVYDRRLCDGLEALGWEVHEHGVTGAWPHPTGGDRARLQRVLDDIPGGATVVVDGLIGCATRVVTEHADRLRLVLLVHMPLAGSVLTAAHRVVATSQWAADWLREQHRVGDGKVHVVEPGVEPGDPAVPSPGGGRMLYVAAVTPDKGHDTLLAALTRVRDLDWHCTCVGALDVAPRFADELTAAAEHAGLADRVTFPGPLPPDALDALRAETDLAVSPSRRESYGMATAEALARGIPVVATAVGGQPEAVGRTPDGATPGLLVPPDDPDALADALRQWLTDADFRARLRRAAVRRSTGLATWPAVATRFADVLTEREPDQPRRRIHQQHTAKGG